MRRFLRGVGAAALVAACVGCAGSNAEDPPAPEGPVTVTLKVSSFTREVTVGWFVTGEPEPAETGRRVLPPWSKELELEPGSRVLLAVGNVSACEILVDGESVVKQHAKLSGEGARCEYTVD